MATSAALLYYTFAVLQLLRFIRKTFTELIRVVNGNYLDDWLLFLEENPSEDTIQESTADGIQDFDPNIQDDQKENKGKTKISFYVSLTHSSVGFSYCRAFLVLIRIVNLVILSIDSKKLFRRFILIKHSTKLFCCFAGPDSTVLIAVGVVLVIAVIILGVVIGVYINFSRVRAVTKGVNVSRLT